MKQAKIYKNGEPFCFSDNNGMEQVDLNNWLEKHIAKNTFGLPSRPELVENENGELVESGVILPAEYEIVIEDISAQVEQQKINEEAKAYLASTDWLIIREVDTGVFCPLEIKQKRQEARNKIV